MKSPKEVAIVSTFLRRTKKRLLIGSGFAILNAALTWVTPWPLKILVDNVLGSRPLPSGFPPFLTGSKPHLLYLVVIFMAVVAILGGVGTYVSALTFANAGQVFSNELQVRVFDHLLSQPPQFFERRKAGDLSTRLIADVQSIQRALVESVPTLVNSLLAIVGIMVILALMGTVFVVAVLALGVFIVGDLSYFMQKVKAESKRARNMEGLANSSAQQAITGLVVVQTNGAEALESRRFSRFIQQSTNHSLRANVSQAAMNASVTSVLNLTIAVFVLFAGLAVFDHSMTIGSILVVTSYARSIYKPLQQLTKRAGIVGVGLAAKERVEEILAVDESFSTHESVPFSGNLNGEITYRNVRFSYGDKEVFHGVNLVIRPGSRIGLVGETGSGKSTLAKMLPRLIEPSSGSVEIDGVSVAKLPVALLRSVVAYLPQETFIFAGSIWENIVYGIIGATRIDAIEAARTAGVMDVFAKLPRGIDTEVSEKGTSLSGGQRQCVAIARAIAKNARIIILDEPTVGVDPVLEELLTLAFERLTLDRTAIVVSHQEATLKYCDFIYRVENGRLTESSRAEFFRSDAAKAMTLDADRESVASFVGIAGDETP